MREQKESMDLIESLHYGEGKDKICEIRTRYCLEWYTRKAIRYKYLFVLLSVINIAVPQISAIVILQDVQGNTGTLVGAIMSAAASFSASLLALLNVREHWVEYRSAAEYIKQQYTLYCCQAPPFHGEDPHGTYLNMIEQYMAKEQGHWIEAHKRQQ